MRSYLMPKNVSFLKGKDLSMIQVKVRTTDRRSSNFDDDIVGLCNIGDGSVDETNIAHSEPGKSFHCCTIRARAILRPDYSGDVPHNLTPNLKSADDSCRNDIRVSTYIPFERRLLLFA